MTDELCGARHPDHAEPCAMPAGNHRSHVNRANEGWPNEDFREPPPPQRRNARGTKAVRAAAEGRLRERAKGLEGNRRSVDAKGITVGTHHPETSHEMAAAGHEHSGSVRRRIYDYLVSRGTRGATDKEGEADLEMIHETYSGTRRGLVKDRWVYDSGEKRLTPSRRRSTVWRADPGG